MHLTRVGPPSGEDSDSSPPKAASRSAMPASPRPGSTRAPPGPSSTTEMRSAASEVMSTETGAPGACFRAFVSPSWTIRYSVWAMSVGAREWSAGDSGASHVMSTGVPARRASAGATTFP